MELTRSSVRFAPPLRWMIEVFCHQDVLKMLAELQQERQQLEEAIRMMERLASGRVNGGRPPAWMTAAKAGTKRLGRPPASENKEKAETAASEAGVSVCVSGLGDDSWIHAANQASL